MLAGEVGVCTVLLHYCQVGVKVQAHPSASFDTQAGLGGPHYCFPQENVGSINTMGLGRAHSYWMGVKCRLPMWPPLTRRGGCAIRQGWKFQLPPGLLCHHPSSDLGEASLQPSKGGSLGAPLGLCGPSGLGPCVCPRCLARVGQLLGKSCLPF